MTVCEVLVVGGTGRVGASTVQWLDRLSNRSRKGTPTLRIGIGGRSTTHFEVAKRRLGLQDLSFRHVDVDGESQSLMAAISDVKLVIHTAGPFQGRLNPTLLHACIKAGVPYCDVSDELLLSRNAKILSAEAAAAGIPAVISCGIWPGVSALMAATAVERMGGPGACDRVELSFHTAGTGGAGPTIVSATFLLLATDVVTYQNGVLTHREPWTEQRIVDFGPGIGKHKCFLLDNPDVCSVAEALNIANCASRFGSTPSIWNTLFGAMKALPRELLYDRSAMQVLAIVSMPVIRMVDALVGKTNAMRVDAYRRSDDGSSKQITLRCVHSDLENCVGQATAAFGMELLRGRVCTSMGKATIEPGVWYPAELQAAARNNILTVVKDNTLIWEM